MNAGGDLTVQGLTVTNGRVFSDDDGGGIYNSGSLTITDCTVSGNSAADDGDGSAICDIGSYEADDLIFVDGFELGDTMAWSTSVP